MLHIHRAERADGLLAALGTLLADPLPDPFAAEVIAVPTRGIERWLSQQLSNRLGVTPGRRDGVCANVDFPFPRRLAGDAVAAACGVDPETDPWLPERAVWSLLEVVDACLAEPWMRSLSAHLGGDRTAPDPQRRARRLGAVRHLADLFDRYALHRPEMVRAWAAGHPDDPARALPASAAWQAELFRRLRRRIGEPGPAERLDPACARLREDPGLLALPPRLALFGLTRLPAGHLRVLRALAAGRDVHLFLLHPSPVLWERVARASPQTPVVRRAADPTATVAAHRLLASWAQDAREIELVLAGAAGDPPALDHHHPVDHPAGHLLARIQADVRADRPPPGAPLPGRPDARPPLDPADRSLEVHACHGRARQVEVVRDAILQALDEEPELEPRDVIVMCPDIETFAPLIQATFGAGERADDDDDDPRLDPLPAGVRPPALRVRLADRALRQTNPILGVVAQLLELPDRRLTASQVLDLADREPVRRRFRWSDDDLTRMHDWVADSGIRWGLDAAHRAPYKLDGLSAGTWRAGIDRLLLGVAMTEDDRRLFGGVLPLDDVDSAAIDLAGRFAELVDRLDAAIDALAAPQTIDAWAETIAAAADALTATTDRDAWQRTELQRLLDDVVRTATATATATGAGALTPTPTPIALPELRGLLAERLQGRPTRANFRTGHLTICTLVPMRSVPHRVVCLLGLDDGVFPRKAPRDGDDLMLEDPHVGERDPRAEDRQLLLDALLAAGDRLVVAYTGNDERTNAPRPPAVPVGELLDTVDATVRAGERPARDRVVVRHPLQPFDPRNFARGALVRDRPWSFDAVALAGARALTGGPRPGPGPFLAGPLGPLAAGIVECDDLTRFVAHPVRAFLRRRLGISVRDQSEEIADGLTVEMGGLDRWGVGQRLLEARLAGVEARTATIAEIARGTLPPGVLGQPVIATIFPIVEDIVAAAERLAGPKQPESVDVRVALADGRWLTGTIPGVTGQVLRTATYSRVAAKHRLTAWVRLLALTAAHPDRAFEAATVGRHPGPARLLIARIRPPADADRRAWALERLGALVDLFDRGMREPLPLYCATSGAHAEAEAAGRDGASAARAAWTSAWNFDREDRELEHQLVLGGVLGFDELPGAALAGYARRLWADLLAAEELSVR